MWSLNPFLESYLRDKEQKYLYHTYRNIKLLGTRSLNLFRLYIETILHTYLLKCENIATLLISIQSYLYHSLIQSP